VQGKPLVSVVIPTFNRTRQVQAALKSVLAQTCRDFEVVIVDDGSTDGTEEDLRSMIESQRDSEIEIRYVFQHNQGQSVARNRGAEEARGEWIAFLDSDDVWLPEKLEHQLVAMEKYCGKCWAYITDAQMVDDLGLDTTTFQRGGKHYDDLVGLDLSATQSLAKMRDPFCVSTLVVHGETAKRIGWFEPHLKYAEDHDFLLRLSLVTPICYVNKMLCIIDLSKSPEGSVCRPWDQVEVRLRSWQEILEKWLSMESKLPTAARKTIVHNLRCVHSAWANWYLERHRCEDALVSLRMAVDYEVRVGLLVKLALIQIAPSVAKRIAPKMQVG